MAHPDPAQNDVFAGEAPDDGRAAGARLGFLAAAERIERALGDPATRVIEVVGADGALGAALAARLASPGVPGRERPVLFVVSDEDEAEARLGDLVFFLGERAQGQADDPTAAAAAEQLPAEGGSPYAEMQPDRRVLMARMALLYQLARRRGPAVVVASASAVFRRVIPHEHFASLCFSVESGATIDREEFLAGLVRAGFQRVQVVEDAGTFAVRGAVVDLFPPVYRHPVRIELDGDTIESIRLFDATTQRTLRTLPNAAVHPVRETVAGPGSDPRARILAAADAAAVPSSKTRHLIAQIEAGESFFGIESLAPAFHARMTSVLDYLPDETLIVLADPGAIHEELRRSFSRLRESAEHRRAEHLLALPPGDFMLTPEEAEAELAAHRRVALEPLVLTGGDARDAVAVHIEAEPNTSLRAELAEQRRTEARRPRDDEGAVQGNGDGQGDGSEHGHALRERLKAFLSLGLRVRLVAGSRAHAERLVGLLRAIGLDPRPLASGKRPGGLAELFGPKADPGPLVVLTGSLGAGFRLPLDGLALIAEAEIFGPRAQREHRPARAGGLGDLGEIAEGDLVVHEEHGVGRYRGLKRLDLRGVAQDFLHIEYDGGIVYLPVYRIGQVRRYVGAQGETVRLDKVGGKTWQEKRRRVSVEARKVAEELLQLYAQRLALPGHAFPAPDISFSEFEETFAFDETPDQEKAINAVLEDMQQPRPMDRLVCGDVGYGKTEVALRATMLAVLGGRQVAILAPTTVLAEQHFITFSERMRDFPVRIASMSRFRTREEQKKTITALAEGRLDVVVGTHRLLSKDVRWKNLGLLVIDEEQRFGVTHKERLKELRSQIDVLTLTATPIPRTMQMAMSGLREISIIATPPADRLAIRTFLCHWDPMLLGEAIRKELQRGGQVFFVHNRVQDLPEWVDKIRKLVPNAKVAMGHGQMSEHELEKVMVDFVDGTFDVLCSTTIIESGLDIPRANTMIVNHAERFGLAQLYQMRGRIGRSRERAFCYLVVPSEAGLSAEAKQRLAVLQRFTELGAGFQIATHDLEIRGAGDLLGDRQHGVVATVGFDTYVRILEEAVAELRGQPIKREQDPELSVDVPAFLPDDFIPDTGQRLELYRRLAQARDEDDVRAALDEIQDRYGPLPEEATLLGEVMAQKTILRKLGAVGYDLGPTRLVLTFAPEAPLAPARVMALVQGGNKGDNKGGRAGARGGSMGAGGDSRWKLTPDMRLAYTFDDREKRDGNTRLQAARAHLADVEGCLEPRRN
jgi:transcription-repair coupling factor (superfamily II helicase)